MRHALFVVFAMIFLVTGPNALADLGPKPKIAIGFSSALPSPIALGELMQCKTNDCSGAAPLQQLGPQNFSCTDQGCNGMAYGFSPFMQLRVTLKNGSQLTSNIFTKTAFDARYTATVSGPTLSITELP